jgi:hypothetical protein
MRVAMTREVPRLFNLSESHPISGKQMQTTKEGRAIIVPDSIKEKLWPSLRSKLILAKNGPKVENVIRVVMPYSQKLQ